MSDSSHKLSRRDFFRASGLLAAGAVGGPAVLGGLKKAQAAQPMSKAWDSKFSVCDICFNKCGLIARVEDGVVKKLDPNPKFLKSRGMLCARGNAGISQVYDPDRLKYPMLRKGARGEGKWQRIPWDEALDMAAEKMLDVRKKYLPCGHLFSAGTDLHSKFVGRLAEVYGSFNVTSHESLCLVSGNRAFLDTYGEVPFPDVLNSKYVLMCGANRFEALVTPDSIDLMTAMRENGCKLVTLDPRYTKTAALSDEWYAIKPGTDMAFMLALAHVIINEKLYDPQWIAEKTYGIEQLTAHVQKYTPQFAAEQCQIPADAIVRIARDLAANAPASMVYPGRRTSDYEDSTQIRRAFAIVNGLLGNWDRPGGLLAARQVGLKGVPYDAPWYDDNHYERIDEHKVPMMFEHEGSFLITRDAVLADDPYEIRGWLIYKTNPMGTAPNRQKTIKMMDKMDFVTVIDIAMSDTAWYADLVLPSQSYLERYDPCSGLQGSVACACVVKRDPVIEPMYESRSCFDIMKGLANRMELGEYFDFTIPEYRQKQLAGLPKAEEIMERDGVYYNPSKVYGIYEGKVYKTLSKKVELYNQRYEQMGIDPLPNYTEPTNIPKNQFRLIVGRDALTTQTSTANNALLNQFNPTNTLWINTESAQKLGIAHGELVQVTSSVGTQELKANVTDKIRGDAVYMLSGYNTLSTMQHLSHGNGASINELLEDDYDEVTGNASMHTTFVSVTRKVA
ncbi:molybdopterin-dependent oxidoreductase [Pseudodesulfovibrio sp. zrk46]|uniref:molybdopterin-dependent oxidoreductase n=1 Tax=Pseudodesulfovibrio sp. zrk46 TaxID=2725288 RepID=UPI001448E73E|nr:molybdopterin-dependent oxidoreductase [Pseudodesulfovibrio sp. zrk46]QJB55946.1 molybdopterin-dependent oxidoreductase [Pseudodesulfovibrio sp. zrk46]